MDNKKKNTRPEDDNNLGVSCDDATLDSANEEAGFDELGLDFLSTIGGGAAARPIIRPRLLNVIPADLVELLGEEENEPKKDEETAQA